jgi:hypothetical protein
MAGISGIAQSPLSYRASTTCCIGQLPFAIAVAAAYNPGALQDAKDPAKGLVAGAKVTVTVEHLAIASVQVCAGAPLPPPAPLPAPAPIGPAPGPCRSAPAARCCARARAPAGRPNQRRLR